jgi:hypothetical protein
VLECTIKELNKRTIIQVLLKLEHGNNEIGSDDPSFEGKVESARTSNHVEAKNGQSAHEAWTGKIGCTGKAK